jgi:hypothetical protein
MLANGEHDPVENGRQIAAAVDEARNLRKAVELADLCRRLVCPRARRHGRKPSNRSPTFHMTLPATYPKFRMKTGVRAIDTVGNRCVHGDR